MATNPLEGAHMYKSKPEEYRSAADTVRRLVEVNRDAEKGLSTAADALDDEDLARRFRDLGQQRGRFAEELIATAPGADLEEESGTITGTLRRAWIEIKDAATTSDVAILEVAEAGEDRAIAAYAEALAAGLPADTEAVVRRQYDDVKASHDEVRALRDERR